MYDKSIHPKIGLAMSGGGFRATLFHLGSLWCLNDFGYLRKINRICSVSGGSITCGVLAKYWHQLNFDKNDMATNFKDKIVIPIRHFCSLNVDVPSILGGWLSIFKSATDLLKKKYKKNLFGNTTLQDLPKDGEGPLFIIYATSLQSGSSVRFSRPYIGDYKVGLYDNPNTLLAEAVAASSAFPPVLSPVLTNLDPNMWKEVEGAYLFDNKKMKSKMYLTDGGVYDNLGLEAIWDTFETVLVSDAGSPFEIEQNPWLLKYSQIKKVLRVLAITMEQTRVLRKRKLINDFVQDVRKGTYWGITTYIDDYDLPDSMTTDNDITKSMQNIRTRLNPFSDEEQGRLINWGYALADAAMRKHVFPNKEKPGKWPIPDYNL